VSTRQGFATGRGRAATGRGISAQSLINSVRGSASSVALCRRWDPVSRPRQVYRRVVCMIGPPNHPDE
jgi:hypothetical protein